MRRTIAAMAGALIAGALIALDASAASAAPTFDPLPIPTTLNLPAVPILGTKKATTEATDQPASATTKPAHAPTTTTAELAAQTSASGGGEQPAAGAGQSTARRPASKTQPSPTPFPSAGSSQPGTAATGRSSDIVVTETVLGILLAIMLIAILTMALHARTRISMRAKDIRLGDDVYLGRRTLVDDDTEPVVTGLPRGDDGGFAERFLEAHRRS